MSVNTLLTRYSLTAQAEGLSPKTVRHVKLSMGLFGSFMGGIEDVGKVTGDDLRRFIVAMQQRPKWAGRAQQSRQKVSAAAIASYCRSIKSFFAWLKREGIVKENPLALVPTPKTGKKLPKILGEDELGAVFKVAKENSRDKAIIELLLDSGIRLSEMTNLNRDDMDKGVVKVLGKGNKERHVFITDETETSISLYYSLERPEPVGEDKLFLTENGRPLSNDRVEKILDRIGKKAGLTQRLSPHRLRHSYATMSLKYGSNLEFVRRSMGHSDIHTTQIYLSLTDADVQEAHKTFSPVANLKLGKGKTQTLGRPLPPWQSGRRGFAPQLLQYQSPAQQKKDRKLADQLKAGDEPDVVTFGDIERARRLAVEEVQAEQN